MCLCRCVCLSALVFVQYVCATVSQHDPDGLESEIIRVYVCVFQVLLHGEGDDI